MPEELQQVVSETVEAVSNGADKERLAEIQEDAREGVASMVAMVHKVLQASVGAFALTKDEVEEFVNKLVERGEIAEQDGRRLVREVFSRRRGAAEEVATKADEAAEKVQEETQSQLSDIQEETRSQFGKLQEETRSQFGKIQEETRSQFNKMQQETEKQIAKAETMIDQRIEGILARLNIPSKHDIDLLSQKIAQLAEKVDALKD